MEPDDELTDEALSRATLFNLGLSPGWKNIKGHVWRVRHFTSRSTVDGVAVKSIGAYYGWLTVESPLLSGFQTRPGYPANLGHATIPLTHRVNFLQARYFYEISNWAQRTRENGYELLVTHTPAGFPAGLIAISLHFRIMPSNSLETFYGADPSRLSKSRAEDLFGKLTYMVQPEELEALTGKPGALPTSMPRIG